MKKNLPFELVYLGMLSKTGLKPLSRWEKPMSSYAEGWLRDQGLQVAPVCRKLANGDILRETIFSRHGTPIETYLRHFAGRALDRSLQTQRIEGELFGYPSCCVENYLVRPYAANDLEAAMQNILFHWSCPGCRITPGLADKYLPIYHDCRRLFAGATERPPKKSGYCARCALAASMSLLVLVSSQCNKLPFDHWIMPSDPHLMVLPIQVDQDRDYLEDRFEFILGLDPSHPDSDQDGVLDGIELAQKLLAAFKTLPEEPRQNGPYVEHHMMRGLETCNICQETVNMGYSIVSNPLENLSLEIPYLSLHHFLEHSSLSFDGTVHGQGRVNGALLHIILKGDGHSHDLGHTTGIEEVQRARKLAGIIDDLPRQPQMDRPYVNEIQMWGLENCLACGEAFNMGYLEIIHPVLQLQVTLPYIALHFLQCGHATFAGELHNGSTDLAALEAALQN